MHLKLLFQGRIVNIHEKAAKRPGEKMTNVGVKRILNSPPIYFFSYDESWKTYIKLMVQEINVQALLRSP